MNLSRIQLEAKLFRGFADQSRLLILSALADGPRTVTEIVEETELSQPNTSAHLSCLLDCGLIRREKRGRKVFYELSATEVLGIIREAQKILKKHSQEFFNCTNYSE